MKRIKEKLKMFKHYIYAKMNPSISCGYYYFLHNGGKIGKNCIVYSNVEFGSKPYLISIGDNVRITNGVRFVTHDGGLWVLRNLGMKNADVFGRIEIGNNVHIGWNVIIMPGVSIGSNCVIGCGAVVTKDIPDNSVAVGVPAKVIETIDEYMEKAKKKCEYTKGMSRSKKRKFLEQKMQ